MLGWLLKETKLKWPVCVWGGGGPENNMIDWCKGAIEARSELFGHVQVD